MKHTSVLALMITTAPFVAFAAPENLGALIGMFTGLINPILGLLTGLAVLFFVWGIVKYIRNAGDVKKASEGKSIMTYGILALFVLFSFWAIVQFIKVDIFG